ncbi:MarR family winged helix-turn-helix transcriptional regulator [Actinacidiphila bryophytorum]|uniref:MarR family transcriptional regulator n=1 Tax=Actinacidiphila bryophytorum TaxID=1436133 RepID=A0A9W4H8H2_9ACTN|nr:MarR family transcriptional regulator [Actinacidiphila bryophytorum]MBM9438287.1 MarR family transcriptional regulator [Actinacidiphila bryophytorum]MBN6546262.1 MarR family transcriptional regulator [Actinacidiphila bryophytorum]CAG7657899.1 MarR family transcriptional regulator [Actinacidiphila bryophytorum]
MDESGQINHMILRLAHAHRAVAATLLQELGLYPGQELLLMRLWESDHQSQTALAESLQLDPSTVTRTVQRLEQQGFITRNPSTTDRRSLIVSLTPAGNALRAQVEKAWGTLAEITTAGMPDRPRAEALRLLRRMETNLRSAASRR